MNHAVQVLVCRLFVDDVYVVARPLHLAEGLEVSEHALFHVWTEHVFEKRGEIFQLERVARYGELELPGSETYHRNKYIPMKLTTCKQHEHIIKAFTYLFTYLLTYLLTYLAWRRGAIKMSWVRHQAIKCDAGKLIAGLAKWLAVYRCNW